MNTAISAASMSSPSIAPADESLLSRVDEVMARWKKATAPPTTKTSHESIPHAAQPPKDVFTQCHPNNRSDFQARVATFSSLYWFAKPAELNLLTCARFGWINTGPDELACKCCHQTLVCRIDSRLGPEGARKVAKGLRAYLTTHHLDTCPWKQNPSPTSFTQVNFWTPESALAEVHAAVQLTVAAWQHLSSPHVVLDDSFGGDLQRHLAVPTLQEADAALAAVVRHAAPDTPLQDADAVVVASLAVCGWKLLAAPDDAKRAAEDDSALVLECVQCNRKLHIATKEAAAAATSGAAGATDGPEEEDAAPAPKRLKTSHAKINPLHEHRWYCPWLRATPSDDQDDQVEVPGWLQCVEAIKATLHGTNTLAETRNEEVALSKSEASDKKTKPATALAAVKALLDFA